MGDTHAPALNFLFKFNALSRKFNAFLFMIKPQSESGTVELFMKDDVTE